MGKKATKHATALVPMRAEQAVERLASGLPGSAVFKGDNGGFSIAEPPPSSLFASASIHAETEKAKDPTDSIGDYYTYQWFIRAINQFRLKAMDFEARYFQQPKKLACTDAKAVVLRPAKIPDEAAYQELAHSILPPFDYFNTKVNFDLVGKRGGAAELSSWILDHCLEGGVAAWSAAVSTVEIDGVKWRTITQVSTYSGAQLGLDLKNTQFANEKWYIRDMPQMQRTQYDNGYPMGYDSTKYEDSLGNVTAGWQRVEHSPKDGIYRGVVKFLHAEGQRSKYPVPPYAPLVDILTCRWMMTKDNLRTLARRDKVIWLWKFNIEAMQAAGIQWSDSTIKNADGTTGVKKGAMTMFLENRDAVVKGALSAQEVSIGDYISLEIVSPGLELINATDTWTQFNQEILRNSGVFIDDRGRYAKEVSEQFTQTDFHFNRKQVIEPFLSQLYGIIIEENLRWWHKLNGIDEGELNPLEFVSDVGRKILRSKRSRTAEGRVRQKTALIKARLAGDIQSVRVKPALIPSQALRADNMEAWLVASRQGDVDHATLHEAIGIDPDETRARMAREKTSDVFKPDFAMEQLWTPSTNSQTSVKREVTASGDTIDEEVSTSLSPSSPGRPKGV